MRDSIDIDEAEVVAGNLGQQDLSRRVQDAIAKVATAIQEDHGTLNGQTALYWHLISIAASHAKKPA